MSIERLGHAWRDLINEQANDEDRALIAAHPEAAATALAQIFTPAAPRTVAWNIGDYVRCVTDQDLQATILEQAVRIADVQQLLPCVLRSLDFSLPLLEVALRISRAVAIASVYMYAGSFKGNQDCIDWVIEHLGDCQPLMRVVARCGVDSLVLRDPDLLRDMPDWSYSTEDQQVIGNAILHGHARKLAIHSLRAVPQLRQSNYLDWYRAEAGLDDFVMQNPMSAPLWLVVLLNYDLSPLELAVRPTSLVGTAYLARRGPEFTAEYVTYYNSINGAL